MCSFLPVLGLLLSDPTGDGRWRAEPSSPTPLATELVVDGLVEPVWVGALPGDERLFVLEKRGTIRIWKDGSLLKFLQTPVSTGFERGLLAMAFHPDHAVNRRFYLNYTRPDGATVVSEWEHVPGMPDLADPDSERVLFVQDQPFANHNGGDLHFGPDGFLYVSLGDGGSGDDPFCHGQDLTTFLGKVLRIDVDAGPPYGIPRDNPFVGHPTARGEIWLTGLRNPWRFCFDAATGDLYLGDVGQNDREEISFARAGVGGTNYGWPEVEGDLCNPGGAECPPGTPPCGSAVYRAPILAYTNVRGRAVVGGRVYRGAAIPDLQGHYWFADHGEGFVMSLLYDPGRNRIVALRDRTAEIAPDGRRDLASISSFGEDGFGELLVLDRLDGELFRIVPRD